MVGGADRLQVRVVKQTVPWSVLRPDLEQGHAHQVGGIDGQQREERENQAQESAKPWADGGDVPSGRGCSGWWSLGTGGVHEEDYC